MKRTNGGLITARLLCKVSHSFSLPIVEHLSDVDAAVPELGGQTPLHGELQSRRAGQRPLPHQGLTAYLIVLFAAIRQHGAPEALVVATPRAAAAPAQATLPGLRS
jgi:hypothetical protein